MEDKDYDTNSTCIMLVPDRTYAEKRPMVEEAHLTVAYFGRFPQGAEEVTTLKLAVHFLAKAIGGPIKVKANATGLFPEGESFALVDLVDGIGTFYARRELEAMAEHQDFPAIDYTHGFTPHVTIKYVSHEDITYSPEIVIPSDPFEFTFDAIGVWHGKNHYEVAL